MNYVDWRKEKILVTGGTGLVGTNLTMKLKSLGLDVSSTGHSRGEIRYDLRNQETTKKLFDNVQPKVVFHLAARVGGIYANVNQKADFYLENTLINTNVIAEVQRRQVPFVFVMGTGCAYPKRLEGKVLYEKDFLDGTPETTNDAYAYSKRNLLVHLRACTEDFPLRYIYCIPANIYGPFDNFHPLYSHVVPGLIGKFLAAKEMGEPKVTIWGSGLSKRDFLYIEDLISAIIMICDKFQESGPINVAMGRPVTIIELAKKIKEIIGYRGEIERDMNFPEGQKQRLFNTERIGSIGWKPEYSLEQGLEKTIRWCIENPHLWRNNN